MIKPGQYQHLCYRRALKSRGYYAAKSGEVSTTSLDKNSRRPVVGRGLAIGDYDNDGRVDALLVDSEGMPLLLHNQTFSSGYFLTLCLLYKGRDAYGAKVIVESASWLTPLRSANELLRLDRFPARFYPIRRELSRRKIPDARM